MIKKNFNDTKLCFLRVSYTLTVWRSKAIFVVGLQFDCYFVCGGPGGGLVLENRSVVAKD